MPAPTRLIVFDDARASLTPLTDLRAPFELRTGALTTLERIGATLPNAEIAGVFVPAPLAGLVGERMNVPTNDPASLGDACTLLNGRCVLPPLDALDLAPGAALVAPDSTIIAARLEAGAARSLLDRAALPAGCTRRIAENARVLAQPWDIIRHRDAALAHDLALLLEHRPSPGAPPSHALNPEAIRIDATARLYPGVVLDAEAGPIVIEAEAVVRPNAVITGPAFIGAGSTVMDNAVIRGGTVIGPRCKVGGEVGASIFQGHSNKAHDGYLGDSFVGEWVNLGAGTITSNLLNTYSEIIVAVPGDERRRTGLTFLGTIFGDHAKAAIGTRFMTGSIVGTGAMIATGAPPPTQIGNFAWLSEGRSLLYRLPKFLHVCETVMARRGVTPTDALRARLRTLHDAVTTHLVARPDDYQI